MMRFEFDIETLRPVIEQVVAETVAQLEAERSKSDGRIAYTEHIAVKSLPESSNSLSADVRLA